jgi:hypothetical protein
VVEWSAAGFETILSGLLTPLHDPGE